MGTKRLNFFLNAVSIVCVAFLIWQFAHKTGLSPPKSPNTVRPGAEVHLSQIPWKKNHRTVILALSSYCQYCKASAMFYRSLVEAQQPGSYEVVAVTRESMEVAQPVLAGLGIESVRRVIQADLGALGVVATPTLLMVNDGAKVEASWTGKLTESQEKEVFAKLGIKEPSKRHVISIADDKPAAGSVTAEEVQTLLAKQEAILIDSRKRSDFDQSHVRGALNIPLDEMLSRVPHELPRNRPVLVYCNYEQACASKVELEGTMSFCSLTGVVLEQAGIQRFRFVNSNLADLAFKGVPVIGKTCN